MGTGLGIYEELRDLFGFHGRKRASEIESGRMILPFYFAEEKENNFDFKKYLGKSLSGNEYLELIKVLNDSGAINKTISLMGNYFKKARNSLNLSISKEYLKL